MTNGRINFFFLHHFFKGWTLNNDPPRQNLQYAPEFNYYSLFIWFLNGWTITRNLMVWSSSKYFRHFYPLHCIIQLVWTWINRFSHVINIQFVPARKVKSWRDIEDKLNLSVDLHKMANNSLSQDSQN